MRLFSRRKIDRITGDWSFVIRTEAIDDADGGSGRVVAISPLYGVAVKVIGSLALTICGVAGEILPMPCMPAIIGVTV